MMNILLFIHMVIAILLIIVILLQRTGADGISGIGGSSMGGVVSSRSAVNFLTKTTIVLATLFFINAIILANLYTNKVPSIIEKIEQKDEKSSLPIAK